MNTSDTQLPNLVEPAQVEGVVERIVYENPDTGFFVGRLRVAGQADLVTFVGNLMAVSAGETIRVRGRWIEDKRWGRQVRAEYYETVLPTSIVGIEKYLGSGLIHGIGKVYAKRLIDAFGTETLRVIDEQPERLTRVEGIGPKRARQIREAWAEQKAIQSIMVFLQGHGIGSGLAVRIYKRYGDGAAAVLREDPYRLVGQVTGVGFDTADRIARNLGIAKDAPARLAAGLSHALRKASDEGHVYLPEEALIEDAAALLDVDRALLAPVLAEQSMSGALHREEAGVFLDGLYLAEEACERHLKRVMRTPRDSLKIDIEKAIQWVQRTQKIELSPEQQEAVRRSAEAKVLVITGGPGTGKTTLVNALLAIYEKKGLAALLAAPTGRAAKRMEAATGREARTLHRLLEFSPHEGGFKRKETNPLHADLIVIDEMSMVDIQLMAALLAAVPDHARLFLVGDIDQLPSVGPGNVLLDIIASNVVPTVRLQTVFRQAAQSGIIANAHHINRGEKPQFNGEDFFFIERDDPAAVRDTVVELVTRRMPDRFKLDPRTQIQVLAPMHRGDAGVSGINEALQEALNAHGAPLPRRPALRLGDKVIQTRNNYELDVFNGDVGTIAKVDVDQLEVTVDFGDRGVAYPFDELDDLSLAYAITVHKSQGSEYPAIILPMVPQHFMLLQRNVLYTAITRARRLVVIVGQWKSLYRAIGNTRTTRRHTRLAERLRNA